MNTPHQLALEKYNATLVEINQITDQLAIFKVKPDLEKPEFKAISDYADNMYIHAR